MLGKFWRELRINEVGVDKFICYVISTHNMRFFSKTAPLPLSRMEPCKTQLTPATFVYSIVRVVTGT